MYPHDRATLAWPSIPRKSAEEENHSHVATSARDQSPLAKTLKKSTSTPTLIYTKDGRRRGGTWLCRAKRLDRASQAEQPFAIAEIAGRISLLANLP
ncbi:hypothetical protein F443_21888 [Phytophthora nicotianae P1569]|uniref:Uncharacterized protein n=2 Tax=Phytophthora nicotianae TaxID=4792 RepID=V9DYF6_PHYNI|nr:hypothetical protein F443_21888 [Phytophthora nicotianae P1569]ETO59786.1 hypothetical protein F444_21909 [Phytophthora nicotianae P1976]